MGPVSLKHSLHRWEAPHASTDKGPFWLKDIMKLSDQFRGIASATVGPGDTIMLWEDVWNDHFLTAELPRLFSYAKDKQITLAQFMLNPEIHQHFYTPLSQQVDEELCQLNQIIDQTQQNQQGKDTWGYIWGNSTPLIGTMLSSLNS
jgi:hypothetical protein